LAALDKVIINAARRSGYWAAWCVFIEYGRDTGYHFHLWCAAVPPERMKKALRRHWLKTQGLRENSEKVFHFSGPARSRNKVASYLGKVRSGACICKQPFKMWKEEGRWKPFRFHRGDSTPRPQPSAGNDVSERTNYFFHRPISAPVERANSLSVADSSPVSLPTQCRPLHLMREQRRTETPKAKLTPPPAGPGTVRLGLRIAPRYGPRDALVYPDSDQTAEITAHLRRLAARWTVERTAPAGPPWPTGSVEVTFLIPAGQVRDFELAAAAPLAGFGRIFRT